MMAELHRSDFMECVFSLLVYWGSSPKMSEAPCDLCHHLFRSTILHESKMLLKCQAVSDQAVAEALCSVMLLEESSPRQALTDFLLARKAAIQKLLNQPHHGGHGFSPRCDVGMEQEELRESRAFCVSNFTKGHC